MMKGAGKRMGGALAPTTLVALTALATVAHPAAAQVDMTGDWLMEVTTEASGTTMPTLTLEQNGAELTGHYSSETLGEADVMGDVDGSEVSIYFSADPGVGQDVPVIYTGTIDSEGIWTGTLDIAGGLATGTFRAMRAGA